MHVYLLSNPFSCEPQLMLCTKGAPVVFNTCCAHCTRSKGPMLHIHLCVQGVRQVRQGELHTSNTIATQQFTSQRRAPMQ